MDYRTLGRTGVMVSPLCLGALGVELSTAVRKRVDELVEPGTDLMGVANRI